MKELSKRLEDYKVMKRAILGCEREDGFSVRYGAGDRFLASANYSSSCGHVIITRTIARGFSSQEKVIGVYDSISDEEAKQKCYDGLMKFMRNNSHVEIGVLWPLTEYPHIVSNERGEKSLSIISTGLSVFLPRETSFGRLGRKIQDRVNRKRTEMGFARAV